MKHWALVMLNIIKVIHLILLPLAVMSIQHQRLTHHTLRLLIRLLLALYEHVQIDVIVAKVIWFYLLPFTVIQQLQDKALYKKPLICHKHVHLKLVVRYALSSITKQVLRLQKLKTHVLVNTVLKLLRWYRRQYYMLMVMIQKQ